jgi:hypothetical protein
MEIVKLTAVFAVSFGILSIAAAAERAGEVTQIAFKALTSISGPAFELTIDRDGTVQYNGESEVKQEGHKSSQISKTDFQKLVRKIHEIRFFELEDRYDSYHLEPPTKPQPKGTHNSRAAATEATASGIVVTDLPSQIITVVTTNGTKSVEDRLGGPKRLFELRRLILDVTHASQWTGSVDDAQDVPYYDSFPENKRVTYRGLLQSYTHSTDRNAPVAGYTLQLINNPGIDFELKISAQINPKEFDGWIVDATGKISETKIGEPQLVVTDVHRVRKYLPFPVRKK